MASVKPRRRYRSPVREQSAQRSREAVIAAAHAVFVESGYANATIEQIADRAGVSRPTVFGVGTKAQLLTVARLKAIAGGRLVGNDQRFQELLGISDPSELIAGFARFPRTSLGGSDRSRLFWNRQRPAIPSWTNCYAVASTNCSAAHEP